MTVPQPSLDPWVNALQSGDRTRLAQLVCQDPEGLGRAPCWTDPSFPSDVPLCWAIAHRRWALAKVLLELGANPNGRSVLPLALYPLQLLVVSQAVDEAWPPAVLDLAEALLEKGADPHLTEGQQLTPLEMCLIHTADKLTRSKKGGKTFDSIPKNVALAIWRSTRNSPWPPRVRWQVWKVVLEKDLKAWQERLESEGLTPHAWDETCLPSLAATICLGLSDKPKEKQKALLKMGAMGLRWKADWSDDEASTYLASCQAHRLDQRFSLTPETSAHRKERL